MSPERHFTDPERSAGHRIQWVPLNRDARPDLPLPPGSQVFTSPESKCSVIVSHEPPLGWHISVAHPWRRPSWDEIASARYQLCPDDITMAMLLPPSAEYVNVHEHCFHLYECRCYPDGVA